MLLQHSVARTPHPVREACCASHLHRSRPTIWHALRRADHRAGTCSKSAWIAAIVAAIATVISIPVMLLLRNKYLKDEEKALEMAKKLEQDPEKVVGSGALALLTFLPLTFSYLLVW